MPDSRVADPNTMDDYLDRLLTATDGSRYAGRVWTDKSVFAFNAAGDNLISLDMKTDGYTGNVGFNADFAHVFSALASSQVVNEYPPTPIDLVIVFDMSGSMGQDTRYDIDAGGNYYVDAQDATYPEEGVPMADRIKNSRIQKTLDAINQTIDKLMEQNPQNRVAVCGYGANAVVLMPLGHYKRVDEKPYLSVGGMETLYHPSDLVYRMPGDEVLKNHSPLPKVEKADWYWMNNRDTCYTVVVNAQYNTYTGILDEEGDAPNNVIGERTYQWQDIKTTVSNNVLSDDGTRVKAFPGEWVDGKPTNTYAEANREVYEHTSSYDGQYAAGMAGVVNSTDGQGKELKDENGIRTSHLKEAMKQTSGLEANDYVGYFTNTQGGIYLAYKQLADSTATTYTEPLTTGVISTVARIPATIIMSDGGANFSFNEMGDGTTPYTADDWNVRYGQRMYEGAEALNLEYMKANAWTNGHTLRWNALNGKIDDRELIDGRPVDVQHLLGGTKELDGTEIPQKGDEWYKVFIPGEDTLKGWDGLHGLYNQGADITEDGTLTTPPHWDNAGVFYSSDNSTVDSPGTILEVLLTAAYMHDVVKTHYNNGWTADGATEESRSDLFTYTMNVDTEHVPQWGKMRLYPTLNPKEYSLDTIPTAKWYEKTAQFGEENLEAANTTLTKVYEDLYQSWIAWKTNGTTKATIADINGAKVTINSIANAAANAADYETKFTTKDGKTQTDIVHVTDENVIDNIAYNDNFFDVTSATLDETFSSILALILGNVFVPVSGDNDAGVSNSITYQDPLGEYMEIKNQAITATPHHVGDEEPRSEAIYDMSLLLFGEMHGLVRAGIYDWNWNDDYMTAHGLDVGTKPFPMGWYMGDDPKEAKSAEDLNIEVKQDLSGSYPVENPDGTHNSNAEDAWKAGWVFRFNFSTLLQFVPITGVDISNPDVHPNTLPEQVKNTVYTCYRFAGTTAERNALHRNPIYGDVPEELRAQWDTHGNNYPVGNEEYAGIPGVYRLSDIRVWVEDTGDFVDTDGAIAPNSGYDRSLYVNIPAAAIPTELATITMGRDGVLSYETNLGSDHEEGTYITIEKNGIKEKTEVTKEMYENFCAQSTPFRLFYAVGLEEDLILRDKDGNQTGVDFAKISPEYIQSHTVEGQDYVWFISNYYSGTRYGEYTTEDTSHTRGDPTVTFSPGADNRYYVFQKPLPLFAHAYRVQEDGSLKPVDNSVGDTDWGANKSGNGKTTWENSAEGVTGGGSWAGGRYMGTYENAQAFMDAYSSRSGSNGKTYITDNSDIKYEYVNDGIVFLQGDMLEHVTSNPDEEDGTSGGYTPQSISFSSDDYYFILLEFYVPDEGVGTDNDGNEVAGTQKGHMVQYALARKGSEFGSGFVSDIIDNGDMLCWTDTKNALNVQFDYLSKTDTGDLTRGEPTFQKLTTKNEADLKKYLMEQCGIDADKTMPNPDYDPNAEGSLATISVLEYQVKYWTSMQENPFVQAAMEGIEGADAFKEKFKFSVAARPGGIRSGDMSNNLRYKGNAYIDGYYNKNVTKTSNTYYLPTVSDNSGTDNNVIINNYLGNNGRLEIANQMLHVTKMLEAPEGFTLLTDAQKNETFNYQIYVQGVTGKRSAIKTKYNEFSGTWDRQLAYIDVLTDNSDLVVDNDSNRALFLPTTVTGTLPGSVQTAKQVIENGGKYYLADENGKVTKEIAKVKGADGVEQDATLENLYYLYLPSHGSGENAQHTRRLYQNPGYTDSAYTDVDFEKNGTTTFVDKAHENLVTGTESGAENRDSYRPASTEPDRPAGTITYWAQDAELIPVSEVQAAETILADSSGEFATYALETVSGGQWVHTHDAGAGEDHILLQFFTLVIRKPSGETSMTAFESPFKTRSAYMTVELEFGTNANPTDGSTEGPLTADDIYDQIIPTADRPDLFNASNKNTTLDEIAANTAEFTLKHGEGLLLSGLNNRITYRFTEKLTDAQLKAGYTLKRISHVQQRGSESVYLPGVQNIPIYSKVDATYGEKYGSDVSSYQTENGLTWEQADLTPTKEPFAHTNAIMWEYYATMAANSSGNHHQPNSATVQDEVENSVTVWDGSEYITVGNPHTVADNPNCNTASSKDELTEGMCDLRQDDGSILHYMYYQGQFIDPHYEGEASTYLRNMARYGVSPTVHFGVNGEKGMKDALTLVPSTILENQASGDTKYYDYSGVYSVYGNTGWFEEQANFVNTIEPDMLAVTKEVVDKGGNHVTPTSDMVFEYTLELADIKSETGTTPALTGYENLYLWRGSKDTMQSVLKWTDKDVSDKEYTMPVTAPNLDEYRAFIPTEDSPTEGKTYLQPVTLQEKDGKLTYDFKLKADEAVVFYGIPGGTDYTVTETDNPKYPIHPTYKKDDPYSTAGNYEQTGEVLHYETSSDPSRHVNRTAMRAEDTDNRENYYNQLTTGILTVEKRIKGDAPDAAKNFGFTVILGSIEDVSKLEATKYKADGSAYAASEFTLNWVKTDDGWKADVTLRHGEKLLIEGIPLDTPYTVQETQKDGYNLQHVASNPADTPEDAEGNYLPLTENRVTGTITADEAQAYLLFINEKAPLIPFTGGVGVVGMTMLGVLLLGVATAGFVLESRKRRVRNGG